MMELRTEDMYKELNKNGNILFMQRAEMASTQIEAFAAVLKWKVLLNGYIISEALNQRYTNGEYPISQVQKVMPQTYYELDESMLIPWAYDKTKEVSFDQLTYTYWSNVETPNSKEFVERMMAIQPYFIETMSSQIGINGDVLPIFQTIKFYDLEPPEIEGFTAEQVTACSLVQMIYPGMPHFDRTILDGSHYCWNPDQDITV